MAKRDLMLTASRWIARPFNGLRALVLVWATYKYAMTGGLAVFDLHKFMVAAALLVVAALLLWRSMHLHLNQSSAESYMLLLVLFGAAVAIGYFTLNRRLPFLNLRVAHAGYSVIIVMMVIWFTVEMVPFLGPTPRAQRKAVAVG